MMSRLSINALTKLGRVRSLCHWGCKSLWVLTSAENLRNLEQHREDWPGLATMDTFAQTSSRRRVHKKV